MVGRNVTKYSGVDDLDLVSQLGPENLHLSTSTADPDYLTNSSTATSSFDTDTSTLSGRYGYVTFIFYLSSIFSF